MRLAQIERIERTKRLRDPAAVTAALSALEATARSGDGNLLENAVAAARARATVGRRSPTRCAMCSGTTLPGRKVVKGIYGGAYRDQPEYETLVQRIDALSASLGSKPRLMVAKLGQDGHDRAPRSSPRPSATSVSRCWRGRSSDAAEAAAMAVASKVHVVGMSSLAAGHKTLAPQLIEALKAKGAENIIVVVGGVVPRQDYQYLFDSGVAAVFGPAPTCWKRRTPCWTCSRHQAQCLISRRCRDCDTR